MYIHYLSDTKTYYKHALLAKIARQSYNRFCLHFCGFGRSCSKFPQSILAKLRKIAGPNIIFKIKVNKAIGYVRICPGHLVFAPDSIFVS